MSSQELGIAVQERPTAKGGELKEEKRRMDDYKSVHALWDPEQGVKWSCCEIALMIGAWLICIIPIFWFFMFRTVRDYERALIFRLGKLKGGAEGPGVFLINPLTDKIYVVDLRIETYNLPPQGRFICIYPQRSVMIFIKYDQSNVTVSDMLNAKTNRQMGNGLVLSKQMQ